MSTIKICMYAEITSIVSIAKTWTFLSNIIIIITIIVIIIIIIIIPLIIITKKNIIILIVIREYFEKITPLINLVRLLLINLTTHYICHLKYFGFSRTKITNCNNILESFIVAIIITPFNIKKLRFT